MICLAVRFLAGRFHATPWAHHVNEGVPEWPISPWRILRALTAALHTRCPGLDRGIAEAALHKLVAPPLFTLPAASMGHTRHYLSLNTMKRTDTALTIDAFVALGHCKMVHVHWSVDLTDGERRALSLMARSVSYLGRAESWCEIEVLDDDGDRPEPNCAPVGEDGISSDSRCIRVLCPAESMRQADLERTTSSLQREGWNEPPGTRWVLYHRPEAALSSASGPLPATIERPRPVAAELALGGQVLPLFTDAVLVAEQVRAAALSRHEAPSETLSGKASGGERLRDQHRHAHYLPDARDSRNPSRPHSLVCLSWRNGTTAQRSMSSSPVSATSTIFATSRRCSVFPSAGAPERRSFSPGIPGEERTAHATKWRVSYTPVGSPSPPRSSRLPVRVSSIHMRAIPA